MKKYINLHSSGSSLLIIKKKTGIIYQNQAGGNFCLQPVEEGFIVPLNGYINDIEDKVARCFGFASSSISQEDADNLDSIFYNFKLKYDSEYLWGLFSVDREYMNNSFESWIHIKINSLLNDKLIIKNLDQISNKAVLTWVNSD